MSSALLHIVMASAMMSVVRPSSEQVTFYVATNGNNAWSGTLEAPNAAKNDGSFASLSRARDAIRQLKKENRFPKGGIGVVVRGGTYSIDQLLEFTTEDSGTKDAPISYRAAPGESVRLLGGKVVTNWKPVTDADVQLVQARIAQSQRRGEHH